MITSKMPANFVNKSDCIRDIYKKNPLYTNKEIIRDVKQVYKIDVGSNLVCECIGSYKSRSNIIGGLRHYITEMVKFIQKVGSENIATYCLVEAKRQCDK